MLNVLFSDVMTGMRHDVPQSGAAQTYLIAKGRLLSASSDKATPSVKKAAVSTVSNFVWASCPLGEQILAKLHASHI